MSLGRDASTKDGRTALVREATPGDAQAWIEHANRVGSEKRFLMTETFNRPVAEIERQFRDADPQQELWLVAEVAGAMVGSANARRGRHPKNAHTAEMGMAVRKEFRGLGVGKILLETIIAWSLAHGITKLRLGVFANNEAAMALYRRFGFQEEGRLRKEAIIDGEYVDEVLMALWLEPAEGPLSGPAT